MRQNLTMRMFMRRFTRLANAFQTMRPPWRSTSCGWILIGVIIGALAAGSINAVKAQGSADAARLKVSALMPIGPFGMGTFVKDTKSTGGWLVSANGIAVAPLEACQY